MAWKHYAFKDVSLRDIILGRTPIINEAGELAAYDLDYSAGANGGVADRAKSSKLISAVLNTFGSKKVLGGRAGIIRIDEKFLLGDMIRSSPKELFVYALCHSTEVGDDVLERVKMLHEAGYRFALDTLRGTSASLKQLASLFPYLDFFKIDISDFPEQYLAKQMEMLGKFPLQVIACGVDDHMQYAVGKSVGCSLFSGYYFAEPVIIENPSYDPDLHSVVHLYNLLLGDCSIEELVREFETNQPLTMQLLQYINSSMFSLRQEIASVHHVLALIGRKHLGNWLMLLIYGKSLNRSRYQRPLMLTAMSRSMLMTELLKLMRPHAEKALEEKAFFVGLMSLAGTVFSMPLRMILKDMHISEDVADALLEQKGFLGALLLQVEAIETFDKLAIIKFASDSGIALGEIYRTVANTMEYVHGFEAEAGTVTG
jgi:EAL and modified HD-GYP domain-containing signal transduction protein